MLFEVQREKLIMVKLEIIMDLQIFYSDFHWWLFQIGSRGRHLCFRHLMELEYCTAQSSNRLQGSLGQKQIGELMTSYL